MTSAKASCSYIPGFKSWLRALILTISLIPVVFVLHLTKYPTLAFLSVFSPQSYDKTLFAQIKVFLVIGWFAFVGIAIPVFVLGHIHQFLWGEPNPKLPQWMPSWKSQIEGFWDWFVCVTSVILWAFGYVAYHDFSNRGVSEQDAPYLIVFFLILTAYLYHIGFHLQLWFKKIFAAIRHWLETA